MIRLGWFDSSKVIELALGKMRKLMRPWLEVTNTETGGQSGQTNFTVTHSPHSIRKGRGLGKHFNADTHFWIFVDI